MVGCSGEVGAKDNSRVSYRFGEGFRDSAHMVTKKHR